MPKYSDIQKEETFKAAVFRDFFSSSKYAYEPNIGNIDFIVTEAKTLKDNMWKRHYLWAESKKGVSDVSSMLTQLVLTIKKTYEKGEHLPPPYIACFDTAKIAFVPFHDILPIFNDNDVNWNVTPSNHTTDDFIKTQNKVEKLYKKNIVTYDFETDSKEIIDFINNNLVAGNITSKFQINKNNFVIIYSKWLEKVKPSIAIDWEAAKKQNILDGDFFLADILSKENFTFKDGLFVLLVNTQYKFDKRFDDIGFSLYKEVGFRDNQKAHKEFWDKYERPPMNDYWDYIVERRELLVPQDIRERKGSFFTPQIWVQKSQEYLAAAFGENWQDEYVIWDCAAGTGNLLAGLTNKYNLWASTLDQADVDVMHDRIKNGANLLPDHVFKFDFLNDDFSKLPEGLNTIIADEEKRKKLIVYINPPYAEATSSTTISGSGQNKPGVSISNTIKGKYQLSIGKASNEIFSLFIARIYDEIPESKLGFFSKVKFINSQNFSDFRLFFRAEYKMGFIVRADTFDNVVGQFPIGFSIWDNNGKKFPKKVKFKILENGRNKIFHSTTGSSINKWIKEFDIIDKHKAIGFVCNPAPDFLKNNQPYITVNEGTRHFNYFGFSNNNIFEGCIYFSVRLCIEPTWLNDRDQFLFPNSDNYKTDIDFQNDCLVFTLFHGQNRISSNDGVNHWIPYSETEVNAQDNFKSHFMYDFIHGKIDTTEKDVLFGNTKKNTPLEFSEEAQTVLNVGKELWKYYHAQPSINANASLYDIREYFQGRDAAGKMNNKSGDETYNALIADVRSALKTLALKIQPKVYEYGFLLK
ncbi:MAG: hypothetical protein LBU85_11610 [Treponema sp.]|jgi:hypothetical protein|nr:hypothetical protein [Treponema sp.]